MLAVVREPPHEAVCTASLDTINNRPEGLRDVSSCCYGCTVEPPVHQAAAGQPLFQRHVREDELEDLGSEQRRDMMPDSAGYTVDVESLDSH